jgi:drug/metabolite transporter (DMT)-like permease
VLIISPPRTSPERALDIIRAWQPSPRMATMAIVGTSFAYASTAVFVRQLTDTGMSVVAVAFFRFALTALALVRFVNFDLGKRTATSWGLVSGVVMGGGWIVYVRTIDTADVAVAGVVQMTYPLFALLVGWLLFNVGPTPRSLASAALVVVAAVVGLGAGSGAGLSPLLFIAPASFGFSVSILTERLGPLDPFERLASVAVGASLAMSPLLLTLSPSAVFPTSFESLAWVLAIGAVSALIPMTIYAAAAPTIGTARTAAAGAFELPTVFLIGSVFFSEAVTLGHFASAAIIVGAIALTRSARSTHVVPDEDTPISSARTPSNPRLRSPRSARSVDRVVDDIFQEAGQLIARLPVCFDHEVCAVAVLKIEPRHRSVEARISDQAGLPIDPPAHAVAGLLAGASVVDGRDPISVHGVERVL